MTYNRRTKFGMPNKAAKKSIDYSEEEEDEEVCSVKPKKKQKTNGYYDVPIRSFDQIHGGAGNCNGVSYFDGEIDLDMKKGRSGGVVVNQNSNGDQRPPLLKSSRGRVQVRTSRVFSLIHSFGFA